MSFTRTKEDFACDHCGTHVTGSGYTNHCPKCLWSTHVDTDPGDRASPCGGAMEPMSLAVQSGTEKITHRCTACGFIRRQEVAKDDDCEALIALSATPSYSPPSKGGEVAA